MSDEVKLYVVTRRDLPPATRAVMACHVTANIAFSLGDSHQASEEQWTEHGPPIVLMTVRNRSKLENIAHRYKETNQLWAYSDPDLDDGVCAIAIYALHWNDDRARLARFGEAPPDGE